MARLVCTALLYFERVGVGAGAWLFFREERTPYVLAAALGLSYIARTTLRARVRTRTEATYYRDAVAAILARPFAHAKDAELEALVLGNVDLVARHEADTVPGLWAEGLAAITLSVAVLVTQPLSATLAVAVAAAGGGLAAMGARVIAEREGSRGWARFAEVLRFLMGSVHGRVELAAHGERDARLRALDDKLTAWRHQAFRLEWTGGLAARGTVAVALVVGVAVYTSSATPSLQTVAVALLLLQPFAGLLQRTLETVRSRDARRTMAELLAPRTSSRRGSAPPKEVHAIRWSRWSGGYADRADALTIAELAFERSEGALLLEGPNGSGKSTLLRSLVGLLDHQKGELTIDGVALDALDDDAWKQRVAYLPQRPYLPAQGTIREALAFLDATATDEAMNAALARVELAAPLDDDVNALSAGERQRLAIARLLLRDADLVLLDEPDQNLDKKGLAIVSSIVRELARDKCVIVAAHDPELLAIEGHHVQLAAGRVSGQELKAPASGGSQQSRASA